MAKVMDMADQCDITINDIDGIDQVLAVIRETMPRDTSKDVGDRKWPWELSRNPGVGRSNNAMLSYKGRPRGGGVLTSASLTAGIRREWDNWGWMLEVSLLPLETCFS